VDVVASATASESTGIADLLARRLDGLTIHGVFSPDEAGRAVEAMDRHPEARTPAMFGTMLGTPLPQFRGSPGDADHFTAYLDQVPTWERYYRDAFGFDPFERVVRVVSPMAGGLRVASPRREGQTYNPGNVRWYEPGSGGLPAHVGNEFQMHDDPSMEHLRTTTVTRDFLSWFVVLQAPSAGGALSVFDLLHGSHTPAQTQWTEVGRVDSDFDGKAVAQISPGPGDMILFGGGWRWHRVDQVGGVRARVTYGGFAGPSLDATTLHFWF